MISTLIRIGFVICLLQITSAICGNNTVKKCDFYVDISDGERIGDVIIKNGINYTSEDYFYDTTDKHIKGCICNLKQCLKKCCPDGYSVKPMNYTFECSLNNNTKNQLLKTQSRNFSLFNIIHGNRCSNNNEFPVFLDPQNEGFNFTLSNNGEIEWLERKFNYYNSCIDTTVDQGETRTVAVICSIDEEIEQIIDSIGMIISMPFLLATFIAYALLPDRNLHMKALMSYVINLMFGYLLLVIIQLSKTQFSVASCKSLGYFCLFFFMVSFFWMNVICIDIWFGFSGYRGFSGSKSAERKRFLLYCAYAWGMSILHILTVLLIDSVSNPSSWYAPGIGNGQCFIKTGWAELLYFYGPMGILITINVTLFVITAFKIRSLKKDTAMLKKDDSKRHSYENDKQKFNLYVKLLFAMGVNWSMEIISWAVIWNYKDLSTYIWYLTDFCNAAYGVFIFFIFVFKKNIWKLLQKRYYSFIGKPHLAHSVGQTQTRTTSYSTANTSLHETTNHHPGGGGGGSHITETSVLTTEA